MKRYKDRLYPAPSGGTRCFAQIGFKRAIKGRPVDIRFSVLADGAVVGAKEVSATNDDRTVRIPFPVKNDQTITVQAANLDDTSDIEITHTSFGCNG